MSRRCRGLISNDLASGPPMGRFVTIFSANNAHAQPHFVLQLSGVYLAVVIANAPRRYLKRQFTRLRCRARVAARGDCRRRFITAKKVSASRA